MEPSEKKLKKSSSNKFILGICAGIGEYLGADPVIIRLLFIFMTLFYGSGILFYIFAAILMPPSEEIPQKEDENLSPFRKSTPHSDEEFESFFFIKK